MPGTSLQRRLRTGLMLLIPLISAAALAPTVVPRLRSPSHDRQWVAGMERLPQARASGNLVTIQHVRHARYRSETDFEVRWVDRTVDLDRLASIWVMVEPFREHPSLGHTLLSFGFDDGSYLAVSAEARREPGEAYGVIAGMLGAFELMDVVADERDVFGLRANIRRDDVFLYPLRLDPGERRRVFLAALERLRRREGTPVFYHSLSSNCTTGLVELLRAGRPDALPAWHWSYWLPASFDRLLVARGLVAGAASVEQARARYRINDRAAGADTLPDFSARIRAVSAP